ncbi:MAG TPA: hypothetical protein VGR26_11105 [Acidimicrobiales bacterium]|nr:hypothetical protein [Acidimicrobiales bacterium]
MAQRRPVEVADFLIEHAQQLFPSGGTPAGAPSYELFEAGPLAAAREFFARRFDEAPEAAAGIRVWVTIDLPFFPPMAFYAGLVGDHVELLDVTIEEPQDYWNVIDEDPTD